ncbi:hypothetical protein G7K_3376-t1 [Saitoella complicata NRRL Y-17804]|uniref:DNA helicase n=1 Tax=Saitoella complicata (strain BCRC 22490 / CBS 7301 / JCM 7358 / NBRC 10748 / NRRL Y-17804) TaxID=698492 RepID=A0A0E9NHA7_SAICN|nr:hypothetical protein G7K_3376-t1 [Saitoella complicata NRRL Y-17804]
MLSRTAVQREPHHQKSKSPSPVKDSSIAQDWFEAERILQERDDGTYLVRWVGINPDTGNPWKDTWVAREDCGEDLLETWLKTKESETGRNHKRTLSNASSGNVRSSQEQIPPAKRRRVNRVPSTQETNRDLTARENPPSGSKPSWEETPNDSLSSKTRRRHLLHNIVPDSQNHSLGTTLALSGNRRSLGPTDFVPDSQPIESSFSTLADRSADIPYTHLSPQSAAIIDTPRAFGEHIQVAATQQTEDKRDTTPQNPRKISIRDYKKQSLQLVAPDDRIENVSVLPQPLALATERSTSGQNQHLERLVDRVHSESPSPIRKVFSWLATETVEEGVIPDMSSSQIQPPSFYEDPGTLLTAPPQPPVMQRLPQMLPTVAGSVLAASLRNTPGSLRERLRELHSSSNFAPGAMNGGGAGETVPSVLPASTQAPAALNVPKSRSAYNYDLSDASSVLRSICLGFKEYALPLGMTTVQRSTTLREIKENQIAITEYCRDENAASFQLTTDISNLVVRLRRIATHPFTVTGPNWSDSLSDEEEMEYLCQSSEKFRFLIEWLDTMRNHDINVVLLAESVVVDLLEGLLRGKRIRSTRLDVTSMRDELPDEGASVLYVQLVATDKSFVASPADLFIALDTTINVDDEDLERIREHPSGDPDRMAPLIRLVVINSVEHVLMSTPGTLSNSHTLYAVVAATTIMRAEAGAFDADQKEYSDALQSAARTLSAWIRGDNTETWPLAPLPDLKTFYKTPTASVASSIEDGDRADAHYRLAGRAIKRGMAMEDSSTMSASQGDVNGNKRLRLVSEDQTSVSDELKKQLDEKDRVIAQLRQELARTTEEKQSTVDDFEEFRASVYNQQERYRQLDDELRTVKRDNEVLAGKCSDLEKQKEEWKKKLDVSREEKQALQKRVDEGVHQLAEIRGGLDPARAESLILMLRAEKEALERGNEQLRKENENLSQIRSYMTEQYQEASSSAAQVGMENTELKTELEKLRSAREGEVVQAKALSLEAERTALQQRIKELEGENGILKENLTRRPLTAEQADETAPVVESLAGGDRESIDTTPAALANGLVMKRALFMLSTSTTPINPSQLRSVQYNTKTMANAASGWDQSAVYYTHVLPAEEHENAPRELERSFETFIQEFRLDKSYIYRDQLRENVLVKQYVLEVDVGHLIGYNEDLAHVLVNEPADMLPLLESAVKRCARRIIYPGSDDSKVFPDCQVTLKSESNLIAIRDLNASYISKLIRIPGIVIGASTLSSKATHLNIMCKACKNTKNIAISGGFSGIALPRTCDSVPPLGSEKDCPMDPFVIIHDKCTFIDQQVLKVQEAPDMVPVGELPRHILVSADRYLTNKVVPGTRCTITGIYSIYQNKQVKGAGAVAIRNPYVRVVGLQVERDGNAKGMNIFSDEEEEEFLQLSRNPNLYEMFANSIGPSIYGNEDIKKAIACLLFGGSKKILPDGMKLRGDINVLLLGDPGTAKSQLLKFVEKVAPISVYTSGKGSSAAGLTASVQRDAQSREFYLEGGAMVLADGGVVCIDEFDKMRDEDRVAIHEAMEQQTISIAKAGITTILNSRTSVLAAANPIFGRYDDMKTPGENIDFQTTILSRFDMIFIVKDEHNENRDKSIARHVMNIHMNRAIPENQAVGEIPIEKMKRYITYCKAKCAPRLTPEAAEKLSSHFVAIRKQIHQVERDSNERSSIPITVRQLEAIVRITESLAKMTLSPVADEEHVDEAIRLFLASTMDAVSNQGASRQELVEEVTKIEAELRRRLPIGWKTSMAHLTREFVNGRGYSQHALERALQIMEHHAPYNEKQTP